MNSVTRLGLVVLASLGLAHPAAQAAATADTPGSDRAAGAEFLWSNDSEGFHTRRLSLEYFPDYSHADQATGVRVSDVAYSQNDWSRQGQKVSLLARRLDPATANGWQLDAGVSAQGGHTLATLDGSYRAALARQTGLELFINRDWVETRNALDRGIDFTFVGAALEQGLGAHVTAVGVAGAQFFSDGNRRDHGRVRLIYQPSLDLGLTLQARYRTYHSSDDDVGGAYFNPKNYNEGMLAVGWRQRVQGWTATLTAGLGQEKINDDPRQQTKLLEAGLQSPVRGDAVLKLRGGYNRSASFTGPNYQYRYLQGEWVKRF